jgi:hypothetical protein
LFRKRRHYRKDERNWQNSGNGSSEKKQLKSFHSNTYATRGTTKSFNYSSLDRQMGHNFGSFPQVVHRLIPGE